MGVEAGADGAAGQAQDFDLVVIGGGVNGAGIARDAAGRGLRVLLCEKDDLAQATSSASTKLIHGGLRYLELYDFALVRHALKEREVLLRAAPHIIWPLRFVLPHHAELRPAWLIRLGLFLYDHLGGRKLLPASRRIDLRSHPAGGALKDRFKLGFEYSDCWVQDSRLVVLNARDAHAHGAEVATHTECTALERLAQAWHVTLLDHRSGTTRTVTARAVVNAAGPWVEAVLDLNRAAPAAHGVRLVKGSHVVVRKLFDHPYPYIFQNGDGRVLFAIPYEGDYTLLGTTDIEVDEGPGPVNADAEEVAYICTACSEYFARPVTPDDVVWSYSGVRPLFDDAAQNASTVTRDYVLHLDDAGPPIVSVFGGKITTYRRLAEEVLALLTAPLAVTAPAWTATASLPGGDIPDADFGAFLRGVAERYPWLDPAVRADYARNYGTEMDRLLRDCNEVTGLGEDFGGGLFEAELEYLVRHEWVASADDVLWRRTRKGLHVPAGAADRVEAWLEANAAGLTGPSAAGD